MYTCSVCGSQNDTLVCPSCGFDSSCDYELHPTLQQPATLPDAVSLLRARRNAPATPSVEAALSALRAQGWDEHILSKIGEILSPMDAEALDAHNDADAPLNSGDDSSRRNVINAPDNEEYDTSPSSNQNYDKEQGEHFPLAYTIFVFCLIFIVWCIITAVN